MYLRVFDTVFRPIEDTGNGVIFLFSKHLSVEGMDCLITHNAGRCLTTQSSYLERCFLISLSSTNDICDGSSPRIAWYPLAIAMTPHSLEPVCCCTATTATNKLSSTTAFWYTLHICSSRLLGSFPVNLLSYKLTLPLRYVVTTQCSLSFSKKNCRAIKIH